MRKIYIALFLFIFVYLLWPYIAVFSLYVDLKTADVAGVEERIDWPSLKKDLRRDLDRLVEAKIKEGFNKEKIHYSFGSLTLSKKISDKIATPEGLIYLFNKPNEFVEQIRQIFKKALPLERINPPVSEKKSFEPEGPNIPNLFDRIEYAFFTKPDSFRLSFNVGDLSFTMNWQLKGIYWQLIRLKMPIKKI